MRRWAKNEIEIVKGNVPGEIKALYDNALKLFNKLESLSGGDSFNKGVIMNALNRLSTGKVLSAITEEDEFEIVSDGIEKCKRLPSLLRITKDGKITYSDCRRAYGIDMDSGLKYADGITTSIADYYYPIELPYMPSDRRIEVYTTEYSTSEEVAYNRVKVHFIRKDEESVDVNRYFKLPENEDDDWVEITESEYNLGMLSEV